MLSARGRQAQEGSSKFKDILDDFENPETFCLSRRVQATGDLSWLLMNLGCRMDPHLSSPNSTCTHTHTYTHIDTHMHTHKHILPHMQGHLPTNTPPYTHVHTHTHAHTPNTTSSCDWFQVMQDSWVLLNFTVT
jgi:hypothetical protein